MKTKRTRKATLIEKLKVARDFHASARARCGRPGSPRFDFHDRLATLAWRALRDLGAEKEI